MQTITENMTEVLSQLLKGETGDANEPMMASKAKGVAATLWAYLASLFHK
jgi:hypothetical protein